MEYLEGDLLWSPSDSFREQSNMRRFSTWLGKTGRAEVSAYDELWKWSVENLEDFWGAIWDYYSIESGSAYECVLKDRTMPGAEWFPGSTVNFAEHILRNHREGAIAIHAYSELDAKREISWEDLEHSVQTLAKTLRAMGVVPGDRVVSYLPNIPETVVVLLATASVGAVFSSCSPDFGSASVTDRFSQIEPKVIFCTDGYRFGGKDFDRRAEVKKIVDSLTCVKEVIQVPYLYREEVERIVDGAVLWDELMSSSELSKGEFYFEKVPFDHPLWVVYSSGTTGLPKPIVHGHGGIILEFLKLLSLHMNMKADSSMFFYTSTGWMMWNLVVGALITGASSVLYEGSPMGDGKQADTLWRIAEHSQSTFFGVNPTFVAQTEKHGFIPKEKLDLSCLEGVLLGGSPATPEIMAWCYDNIKTDIWVTTQSGGTDICSAFVGGSPTLPVYAGEIQARCLGVDVQALDPDGQALLGEAGELVVMQPMPSMPIYFWNDSENKRYLDSYFSEYEGRWCHGDNFLINERGGCYIYGRSDSTLNRYGVRIGTAEIYRVVEALEEVEDSLVVNLNFEDGKSIMPLFVQLKEGVEMGPELQQKICSALKSECSPRHVPDKVFAVSEIPYTLTNKKMEVPVKKILAGVSLEKAANVDAMRNPAALKFFVDCGHDLAS